MLAELLAGREIFVVAVLLAHIPVHPEMMEEIIALEYPVLGDDPVIFFRQEGRQYGGGNIGVIIAAQRIADIVQQRHHDIFLVTAIAMRARCGLERMLQPVDREAAIIAVKQTQMGQHALRQRRCKGPECTGNRGPVLGRPLFHGAEFGLRPRNVIHADLSRRPAVCAPAPVVSSP